MKGWASIADQIVEEALKAPEGTRVVIPLDDRWLEERSNLETMTTEKRVLGSKGVRKFMWDCRGVIEMFEQTIGLACKRDGDWLCVTLVGFKKAVLHG